MYAVERTHRCVLYSHFALRIVDRRVHTTGHCQFMCTVECNIEVLNFIALRSLRPLIELSETMSHRVSKHCANTCANCIYPRWERTCAN
jgi:hypothetical protein